MKKKVLIWVLAAVLVLSMAGCAAGAVSTNDKYVDMEPTAAAEAAAAETKDTTGLSDIIRVPFGYLLDWLYVFSSNYGADSVLSDRQAGAAADVGQEQEEHAQNVPPVAAGQGP